MLLLLSDLEAGSRKVELLFPSSTLDYY